ncbi:MAG: hypothetical protein JO360_17965 [Acidobacteria bacterium]|nr:hypothetical protein [Acidobacteriota bacterium]
MKQLKLFRAAALLLALSLSGVPAVLAQQANSEPARDGASAGRTYPKEIRGYKLERAKVEIRKRREEKNSKEGKSSQAATDEAADTAPAASPEADALIQFGDASIARMTPLGITLEVPVTIAAVKQKGHVDFLTFEDMVVNDISVTIEDYNHPFDLPTDKPMQLPQPVRLFISTTSAVMGALGEWNDSKPTWPVTGRVYVFGQFKKFIFKFKRVVPVELSLSLPNPLTKNKTK